MHAGQNPGIVRRRYTLVLLTAMSALAFMDRQILAVLVQPVKTEFALSDLQIGLITGLGFALTFSALGVPLGRLADRCERRGLIAWCRGAGGLLAALGALSTGFWGLMLSRAGGAVSDAGGAPASMAMVADLFPPEQRSRAMSVFGTGASIGALLALLGGSWMAQQWGWRATLALVGLGSLGLALLLRASVTEPPRLQTAMQGAQPGAVRDLWRGGVTRWLIVGASCVLLAGYSFGAWNTALLVRHHGLSLQGAGWVSGSAALASVVGGLFSGWLTDRLARRDPRWQIGVPVLGMLLALPAGLAYLMLPPGALSGVVVLVVLYAFFITWWVAPTYAALSLVVPAHRRATASAVVLLAGSIFGSGLGPIFTGWLSDVLTPWVQGDGLRVALACAVSMLLPGGLAFARAMQAYPAARTAADRLALAAS
ncbi:MFS transporter [Caldimonas tepidiphila]|uniref:MFS transporter n=1 Tax=Caldimonas tepidiphila TaxID=2315841 RepID=UPI000E5A34C6|nr:MFS transporter [Caldimonas tepidiphila]